MVTALLLLIGWQAPALAAVSIGIHLASDGHAHHELAIELALAATHGHHHEVATAPHDHSAVRVTVPSAPTLGLAGRPLELAAARTLAPACSAPEPDASPPTGSPPLFYTHCALLL
jgi:hypothetical protein